MNEKEFHHMDGILRVLFILTLITITPLAGWEDIIRNLPWSGVIGIVVVCAIMHSIAVIRNLEGDKPKTNMLMLLFMVPGLAFIMKSVLVWGSHHHIILLVAGSVLLIPGILVALLGHHFLIFHFLPSTTSKRLRRI